MTAAPAAGAPASSLTEAARAVLCAAAPSEKVRLTRAAAAAWECGAIADVGRARPPARPSRPERPPLAPPRGVPRRRVGTKAGRVALLHAVAHIEFNAIDLAWDLIARFADDGLPRAFYDDWVAVADDEARHHALVAARLSDLGAAYGDLPAHDGLWQAAEATSDDILARLAVVPMVLEARGLDVTPGMIADLERTGDTASVRVLQRILADEVGHVRAGARWFRHVCRRRGLDPDPTWRDLVRARFRRALKPPFNADLRAEAGMAEGLYTPLAARC